MLAYALLIGMFIILVKLAGSLVWQVFFRFPALGTRLFLWGTSGLLLTCHTDVGLFGSIGAFLVTCAYEFGPGPGSAHSDADYLEAKMFQITLFAPFIYGIALFVGCVYFPMDPLCALHRSMQAYGLYLVCCSINYECDKLSRFMQRFTRKVA